MSIAIAIHLLAALIWVGGMFFAYMVLRPVAGSLLEPPVRLTLWSQVFSRFFPWVWGAIVVLLGSGYHMLFSFFGGFAGAGVHIHIMHGLGWLMILIFLHVFFAPRKRLAQAVADQRWPDGAKSLAQIRILIGINTVLGLIVVGIASGGRYFVN